MYVTRIRIEGVRGFHGPRACDLDFTRPDGTYAGWTVLAGRNGSGKTTLLRAIAVALAGPRRAAQLDGDLEESLSFGETTGLVDVTVGADTGLDTGAGGDRDATLSAVVRWQPEPDAYPEDGVQPTEVTFTPPAPRSPLSFLWSSAPPPGWFHSGYGPFRRQTGTGLYERNPAQPDRSAALRTLFEEQSALTEAFDWLVAVHLRTLEERPGARELKAGVLALLSDGLVPDSYVIEDVDSEGMWLRRRTESGPKGPRVELRRMSDGQRTTVALVLDIVRQMYAVYDNLAFEGLGGEDGPPRLPYPGVVLIDEVDAHLHMSWQKRIGEWLTSHFPAVQFIVSTHSPYICQAAGPGGLIRLPGPNEPEPPRVVDEDLYGRIVYGTGDDAALSELFGLDSPYSDTAHELRDRLAELEYAVLTGKADTEQTEEYLRLRDRLASSPVARVDEVMGRYHQSRGHKA
ncbi:AAA family ATPase [Streptomyces albulus]|uniref:AAA family ATPase n=1 Tax=Streptomyces noursei TaxID=1971 RepID=UPI001F30D209|nr:AAA family ATPase [Streptomyces noursei]MCE4948748.1 AAA family ATPase [Streptomyces noursei]